MGATARRLRASRRPRSASAAAGRPGWRIALWAVVVASAAAGVVLRFVAPSPLWLDEALSVNIASLPLADAVQALRHDGHPLLYYAVLGAWLDAVGDSDAAVRSLSALFSLASVAAVWAATRRRLGPEAARYAAVLAITSPFLIRYGSEARMYALVVLLAALGWSLTDAAVEEPKPWRLAALAMVVAAGLHTHYWMIWPALAACTVLACLWRRRPDRRRSVSAVLAAYVLGGLTLVPWLPVLAAQAAHTGTPWATWARPAEVAVESIEAMGGGERFEPMLLGVVLLGAIVLGATALGRAGEGTVMLGWPGRHRAGPLVAVAALTLGAGGLVAMAVGSAFEARYTAVVIPLMLALAGRGLAALPGWAAPAALAAIAAFSVAVAVDEARRDRSQGEEVADAIDLGGSPDDTVVICPDQLAPAVLRYLDTPATVLTHPPTADPRFVDWYDYRDRINGASADADATAAIASTTAIDPAASGDVWLVTATGYHGFGRRCDQLAAALSREQAPVPAPPLDPAEPQTPARAAGLTPGRESETVVFARPVYEPMFLFRYAAAP